MTAIQIGNRVINYEGHDSVLTCLRENNVYISAPCNGMGHCGKCSIKLESGFVKPSDSDLKFFTSKQLDDGFRLACTCYPDSDITISLGADLQEDSFEVVSDFKTSSPSYKTTSSTSFSIAIDIGTTTIAAILIDDESSNQIAVSTGINHQRSFGSDVISRIKAANEGSLNELSSIVRKDLSDRIHELLSQNDIACIKRIVVGGNSTMIHLLMGYSCDTLGVYPFDPVDISFTEISSRVIFPDTIPECSLVIMPGISTFVGGDIVSGIYSTGLYMSDKPSLLIDLGTNGEIALGNKDKILVTSTAAGPAFEGGNISCGTGSILGAVSDFEFKNGLPCVTLIGGNNISPSGICGTGVVAITAALLDDEIIDETGAFCDEYEDGYPFAITTTGEELVFTQADVREIQLAKAAICAGIEVLMDCYGVLSDDIDHVYIAGGFGLKLNLDKAMSIGLFPSSLRDKVSAIGNSCLGGLAKFSSTSDSQALCEIAKKATELSLSTDAKFNDLYIDNMYF